MTSVSGPRPYATLLAKGEDRRQRILSVAERLCVSLCYGCGLSHAEAADALNTPLGTVKSHVKRGLDKLRERLAWAEPDETGRHLHG